jgi:hypothetical protein
MEQPNQDNHPDYHSGIGTIVYDPYRGDMKGRTKWWCIVEVDKEITRYYRWWLQREKHIILQKPAWDAHISVIRGEHACSQHPEFWKKYQGQKIHFKYEHGNLCREADADGGFFYWIDVDCNFLNQVRAEFGLPRGWRFHLTIGRTYQYEARKPKGKL